MTVVETALLLAGITIVVFLVINDLDLWQKRRKNNWKEVDSGHFLELINKRTSSGIVVTGALGYYAKIPLLMFATLVFTDGRRLEMTMIDQPLLVPGTFIKVLKNNCAEFKIEIPDISPSSCL